VGKWTETVSKDKTVLKVDPIRDAEAERIMQILADPHASEDQWVEAALAAGQNEQAAAKLALLAQQSPGGQSPHSSSSETAPQTIGRRNRTIFSVAYVAIVIGLALGFSGIKVPFLPSGPAPTISPPVPSHTAYVYDLWGRANQFNDQCNYQKSIELLNQAIALAPYNGCLYNNRADDYISLNQLNVALMDSNKACDLHRNEPRHYNNRADLYRKLGKFDLAR
jgi:tetratricopeptide (TPR) repeat protein